MALLTLEGVWKTYAGQAAAAVADVSFTIDAREIVSLVGRSGAGKSTLLRLIYGLDDVDAGRIALNGETVRGPSRQLVPGHKAMSMVHQSYGLSPTMNVFDNISQPLLAYTAEYQRQRVGELLELCRLQGVAHKFPRELSGGEQQRVGLAKALARKPALVLMDEPFSNLDRSLKREIRNDVMHILRGSGTAAILVTHDPADALAVSDRVAVMQQGRLVQLDTPRTVYAHPANAYTARLFGEVNLVPINQWPYPLPSNLGAPPLLACIRAEHIHEGQAQNYTQGQALSFEAKVIDAQFMGGHSLAEIEIIGHKLRLIVVISGQVCNLPYISTFFIPTKYIYYLNT